MNTITVTMSRKAALLLGAGFAAITAFVTAGSVAWAGHQFTDVPDSHPHHEGISYVRSAGIIGGCGDGTTYCPDDVVRRSHIATFLHRASGNSTAPPSVNAARLSGQTGTAILRRIRALENKLEAVAYDPATKVLLVKGANLQIVNGEGSTTAASATGLGNLIVGYNENYNNADIRTGSHNLVVGPDHSYTSHSGFVAGYNNTISAPWASVCGGVENTASDSYASVSGGIGNTASAIYSSVSGGYLGTASGRYSSVSGGYQREATGDFDWRAGTLFEDF